MTPCQMQQQVGVTAAFWSRHVGGKGHWGCLLEGVVNRQTKLRAHPVTSTPGPVRGKHMHKALPKSVKWPANHARFRIPASISGTLFPGTLFP